MDMIEILLVIVKTMLMAAAIGAVLFGSWIVVCGIVYAISTLLKYEYSRALATALWIVLVALRGLSSFE